MRFSYKEMKQMLNDLPNELNENETINVHHCKSGKDNDRCYITNKGERILFYCHHCGSKGSIKNSLSAYKRATGKISYKLPPTYHLPPDCEFNPTKWPVDARLWLLRASVSDVLAKDKGMGYSPSLNRVCVPVTFEGEYRGYVARRIGEDGPKYLARANNKDKFIYSNNINSTGTVVIVEDILSSIRISNLGYNSIAIQGTNITDSLLDYITDNYNNYIIYLDNDNRQVKLCQAKLKSQLSMYGKVNLIKAETDPKELNDDELEDIIND